MSLTCILSLPQRIPNSEEVVFGLYCIESGCLEYHYNFLSSKREYPSTERTSIETFIEEEGDFFLPLDFLVCYP